MIHVISINILTGFLIRNVAKQFQNFYRYKRPRIGKRLSKNTKVEVKFGQNDLSGFHKSLGI